MAKRNIPDFPDFVDAPVGFLRRLLDLMDLLKLPMSREFVRDRLPGLQAVIRHYCQQIKEVQNDDTPVAGPLDDAICQMLTLATHRIDPMIWRTVASEVLEDQVRFLTDIEDSGTVDGFLLESTKVRAAECYAQLKSVLTAEEDDPASPVAPSVETRALFEIFFAMRVGYCPKCGLLDAPAKFHIHGSRGAHQCPQCQFTINVREGAEILNRLDHRMQDTLRIFEQWRKKLNASS